MDCHQFFGCLTRLKAFPLPSSQRQRKYIIFSAASAPRAKRAVKYHSLNCWTYPKVLVHRRIELNIKQMSNSRLVYSTQTGSICKSCQKPVSDCICKKKKSGSRSSIKYDGIIRIRREVKGRKGKTVTTVAGLQLDGDELKSLAGRLKRKCGTGGSVKDGQILIQGDHRDALLSELKKQGYTAKLAGG